MKKVVLNQKSYLLYNDMINFKNDFDNINNINYDFILFPPILYLTLFKDAKYRIGTQNFFSSKMGSFTGELNLESLRDINVSYTLIGHYERRKIIEESKEVTKEKLFKSLSNKFNTILCVGEYKKTKKPFNYIKKELNYYLKSIETSNLKHLSIVYEPNWAIGSGEIQCIDKITKTIIQIKEYIKTKYNLDIEVYYGGSITKENAKNVFDVSDGILLGKSSINIDELKSIINELN